jgi:hypothetical protein
MTRAGMERADLRNLLRELVEAGDNVNYDDTEPDPGYGDWRRFNTALEDARAALVASPDPEGPSDD